MVVSSAYLRLLTFLPAILIPVCASSSPAFHMMYSAYKLNKQGDNIRTICAPFPIWNQSTVPHPVLSIASCPAYRFLRKQIRRSSIPFSLRIVHIFFVIQAVFSIVNEAEVELLPSNSINLHDLLCSSIQALNNPNFL